LNFCGPGSVVGIATGYGLGIESRWGAIFSAESESKVKEGSGPVPTRNYSHNKRQWDALFLKFIFIKNCTCFGQIYWLSSGVSTLYTQQMVFFMLVMLTVC